MESKETIVTPPMKFFKTRSFSAGIILFFCLTFLLSCYPPPSSSSQKTDPPTHATDTNTLYLNALKNMNEGNYRTSSKLFRQYINNDLQKHKKEKALYYQALNYYYLGKIKKARETLNKKKYQNFRTDELKSLLKKPSSGERLKLAQILVLPTTDIESYFQQIKRQGYKGVILRMFHNKGDRYHKIKTSAESRPDTGVYFKTDLAPVIDDVLKKAVESADRLNMDLIAWFPTRSMDWLSERRPDLREYKFDLDSRRIKRGKGLDLFNPQVLKYLQNIYSDLSSYNIDGILFQDDLILRNNVGYGPFASREYRQAYKKQLNPKTIHRGASDHSQAFQQWIDFKSEQISEVIDMLVRRIKSRGENIDIYMNIYYDSVLNPRNGKAWFGRDLNDILKNKMIDYFVIMAYHKQISHELKISSSKAIDKILIMKDNLLESSVKRKKLIFKFQAKDWKNGSEVPAASLRILMNRLNKNYPHSIAIVPYEDYGRQL